MTILVVDYHKGNISSVVRGLERAGASAHATDDPAAIAKASALVVPGVGAFADAMDYMTSSGQAAAIVEALEAGAAFLGICLGLQLLVAKGNENAQHDQWVEGLGALPGSCTRLESSRLKVPHVGWDTLDITPLGRHCPLLSGISEGTHMYFTHSYALASDFPAQLVGSYTHYGRSFASVVWDGASVFGCQFHPEKSSGAGLKVLQNFVAQAGEGRS